MANTYEYGGERYTIDPQAQSVPKEHTDFMTCSECGGPGFFRRASENRTAHFAHHPVSRFIFPECTKLSLATLGKKGTEIIFGDNQETLENYLDKRTTTDLKEIILMLKQGPIMNFYLRNTELVEGYKEKQKELRYKNHEISELKGRISELTSEVQHYMEVIEEDNSKDILNDLVKYFDTYLFDIEVKDKRVIKMTMERIVDKIEELI